VLYSLGQGLSKPIYLEIPLCRKRRKLEEGEQENLHQHSLDAPLPWDHIDTGVDQRWLKADLQLALEAVTVPDCSLRAVLSVASGVDFGHNVVIEPPPIPEFAGHFVPQH